MRIQAIRDWVTDPNKSLINFDQMIQRNYLRNQTGEGGIYMIEERHTDQRDFNFAANVSHTFRKPVDPARRRFRRASTARSTTMR